MGALICEALGQVGCRGCGARGTGPLFGQWGRRAMPLFRPEVRKLGRGAQDEPCLPDQGLSNLLQSRRLPTALS